MKSKKRSGKRTSAGKDAAKDLSPRKGRDAKGGFLPGFIGRAVAAGAMQAQMQARSDLGQQLQL